MFSLCINVITLLILGYGCWVINLKERKKKLNYVAVYLLTYLTFDQLNSISFSDPSLSTTPTKFTNCSGFE